MIIAFWLEAWLTKQEILSRYLSSVYFGDGVYGLRAAAHHYFNRDPEKLTLAQSAMLAGLVQAPSRLAPTQQPRRRTEAQPTGPARRWPTRELSARARARRRCSRGRSTAAARSRPAPISPTGSRLSRKAVECDFGEVKVPTTLDRDLQRLAVRAVGNAAIGDAQAALVAMRPDGRVVAMVGGNDYAQFAVQPRHPGAAPARVGVQIVRLSRRDARRVDARQHDRGPADHDRRLDTAQQRSASIAARSRCARPSPGRAMPRRFASPSRSGATMSSGPRATSASPRRCRTIRASRSAPRASACSS